MCGRVRLSSDYSEIKIRLKFAPNSAAPNFEPDWNKPPAAPMLVAIRSIDGERVPKMMSRIREHAIEFAQRAGKEHRQRMYQNGGCCDQDAFRYFDLIG
jgi:hypothetical protein